MQGRPQATGATVADERYATFQQFWPYYLREHARPQTRAYHYVGTSLVVGLAAAAVVSRKWWLLAALPVAGYGFAWAGHALSERNRPATFTYPAWSLRGDLRLAWLAATGRLGAELRRHGL